MTALNPEEWKTLCIRVALSRVLLNLGPSTLCSVVLILLTVRQTTEQQWMLMFLREVNLVIPFLGCMPKLTMMVLDVVVKAILSPATVLILWRTICSDILLFILTPSSVLLSVLIELEILFPRTRPSLSCLFLLRSPRKLLSAWWLCDPVSRVPCLCVRWARVTR